MVASAFRLTRPWRSYAGLVLEAAEPAMARSGKLWCGRSAPRTRHAQNLRMAHSRIYVS
eukprot:SAG11_NODE_1099_length_5874_cov_17.109784_2_plen_59_part_00